MAIAPDGDIVLAGWSLAPGAGPPLHRPAMARFDANGDLDEGFDGDGLLNPLGTAPGAPLGELRGRAGRRRGAHHRRRAGRRGRARAAAARRRHAGRHVRRRRGHHGSVRGRRAAPRRSRSTARARSSPGRPARWTARSSCSARSTPAACPSRRSAAPRPAGARSRSAGVSTTAFGDRARARAAPSTRPARLGSTPPLPVVSRHLPNAAPVAALAAPAQIVGGRAGHVRRRRLLGSRGRDAALRLRPRRQRHATSSTAARTRSRCAASPRPGPTRSACA